MNTKNLEYLQEGLKYLGFDAKLNLELARNIKDQPPAFELHAETKYQQDIMNATLHFRKSDNSDMYFFNKYDATLTSPDGANKNQTFYINKNAGITMKEGYNLLSGRAVNKDLVNKAGERYNAWVQLDMDSKDKHNNHPVKQFTANYGYDLEMAVSKHPVKELGDAEQKSKMMRSLQKGNIQSVTFLKDGKEERMFLEANPRFKSVNLYDAHMKKVYQENVSEKNTANQRQTKTEQKGQVQKQRPEQEEAKKPRQRKGQRM
ncbi:MAG: hypothetical protein EOP56_02670 [Sphingobacteriales bacterium]|nr:MAG: hypothetical protein EOP56_02670 [Sphingobacteriales bacterium]